MTSNLSTKHWTDVLKFTEYTWCTTHGLKFCGEVFLEVYTQFSGLQSHSIISPRGFRILLHGKIYYILHNMHTYWI